MEHIKKCRSFCSDKVKDERPRNPGLIPGRIKLFCLQVQRVQTKYVAYPASYSKCDRGFLPRRKGAEAWIWRSIPRTQVKNVSS
jgi:hypothetical protein